MVHNGKDLSDLFGKSDWVKGLANGKFSLSKLKMEASCLWSINSNTVNNNDKSIVLYIHPYSIIFFLDI